MKIPLLDLKAQYDTLRDEIEPVVKEVFESQYFIMGPKVKEFEEKAAEYCTTSHAVGCASGTDAILLALLALGIGPGDEVITTPYTFFATTGSIVRLGAKPVYCDINADTFNIDPEGIEALVTDKTKAILVVHLYGLMADMDSIKAVADKHGIPVIEDAAQAIGATSQGRRAGTIGIAGCISFFPAKNLGGAGDGGMVVSNDSELAEKISLLRVHGSKPKYYHPMMGINSRLDALQAVVLQVKLKYLDSWSKKRSENADYYTELFDRKGLGDFVTTPPRPDGYGHIYNQYVIRVQNRDSLRAYMAENDVASEIYYPVPLHLQECFAYLGYKAGDMPVSEEAADTTLALPVYPELTKEMQEYVVDTIAGYFAASVGCTLD
ncbi:DegT/DnrJ/EryC1/StrS family aminotransferase [Candidatus Latescibacterota bacterium]